MKSTEKVFVVWGGNQPLAKIVGEKLFSLGFDAIVGGGSPEDMYIGTQIFSQINQCTRAIILAQPHSVHGMFSANLMFEWGYIVAKMNPRKVHVYIIDESHKSLPSDLAGIWCREINSRDKPDGAIADEVVENFAEAVFQPIEIDKTKILYDWETLKNEMQNYSANPKYSEIELAHYVLHSIESSDYYMEEAKYDEILSKIEPVSAVLEFAIQVARASTEVFRVTGSMSKTIPFDVFLELRAVFARSFDFSSVDNNLHLWLTYVCNRRNAALHCAIALNNELSDEDRKTYYTRALTLMQEAKLALERIAEEYKYDAEYVKLFEANLSRAKYRALRKMGDSERAKECAIVSSNAREAFYFYYKARFPKDTYLIGRMTEDYYLSLFAKLEYMDDEIEKKSTLKAVKAYLAKTDDESKTKHARLLVLKSIIDEKQEIANA